MRNPPEIRPKKQNKLRIKEQPLDGTRRLNIKPGLSVSIVLKKDQHTGKLTKGIVRSILTNSSSHPHGIKVRLESGEIGRVKEIFNCTS